MTLNIVRKSKTLVEINGNVRVEESPIRRKEVATKELLSNKTTAGHYKEGKPDAYNKPIVLGEEMDYIDWKNDERCHCVYVLEEETVKNKDDKDVVIERFMKKGDYPDYEAALTAAIALAEGN